YKEHTMISRGPTRLWVGLGALMLAWLAPAHGAPPAATPQQAQAFADEIFRLTNAARQREKLPAFRREVRLDRAAAAFSQYMGEAGFSAHVGPDGVEIPARLAAQGYRAINWGENIAWGYRAADQTVDGWLNSPPHRANLLNPKFRDVGIGVAFVRGT